MVAPEDAPRFAPIRRFSILSSQTFERVVPRKMIPQKNPMHAAWGYGVGFTLPERLV